MGKQKFDRMKKTLSILMLAFVVVPLTAVAANAASGSAYHGHSSHGHGGHGHGGYGPGNFGGPGFGMGGPFGYYPPAPYGMSGDNDVVCGPYGCMWNQDTHYIVKNTIAENGW